jgi:hypothetical protein
VSEPLEPEIALPVHQSWWVRWRQAIITSVLFVIVGAGVAVANNNQSPATTTTTAVTTPGFCPPDAPITCYTLSRTIKDGMKGEDVRRLQQRLKDLYFDPGRIDGIYGGDTMMAVWAFQTLVQKMTRDTIVDFVTPVLWESMRGNVTITPRRQPGSPNHVEVYLPEQVMAVFKGQQLLLVTHISTGTNEKWCEEVTIDPGEDGNKGAVPIKTGVCGEAITPGGIYYFYNRKLGLRESKLGTMWNPVYFNFGIAIHGAMMVPKEPASHGCVRIPIFVSNYFPALVQYNDRVYVFDGVKEPEDYGSVAPPWDKKDPNYTTTTSTSTSTTTSTLPVVTSTTVAPKTTVPKTTIAPVGVTTTAPVVPS